MPELFWIALLYRQDPTRASEITTALIDSATALVSTTPPPIFAFASQYSNLPSDLVPRLQGTLIEKGVFDELQSALLPQEALYPDCPMNVLFQGRAAPTPLTQDESLERVFKAGQLVAVRRTPEAAVIQSVALLGMALVNPKIMPLWIGLEHLHHYPETKESRAAEQQVRLIIGGLSGMVREDKTWRESFWRRGFLLTSCIPAPRRFHEGAVDTLSTAESLVTIFKGLDRELVQALKLAWSKSPVDLAHPLESELYGALLARQLRCVRHLLNKPGYQNAELGGLVLRGMAESAITLGWLIRRGRPEDREQFWLYGLGQEKLALDHLAATSPPGTFLPRRLSQDIAARREWLESQRTNQLLPVDLANWTTLSIRQLAEQAQMLDTYNVVYGPMSAHVHGSWNAIGRTCMRYCVNPLHRFHMIPDVDAVTIDLTVPLTALRVLREGWNAYREWATNVDELSCCDRALETIVSVLDASGSDEPNAAPPSATSS